MSYHECGIHQLTPSQKAKLRRGGSVRMKLGKHHTLPLREDQLKKLARAHSKGQASTVILDPYQVDILHGSGFFDSMKKALSHPITKQISQAVRPLATNMARGALTSMGPMGQALGNATIDVLDAEASKRGYGARRYVHHDKRIVEPVEVGHHLKRGKGFFDSLKKAASSNVAKSISKSLRPMATDFIRSKLPQDGVLGALGNLALDESNKLAERHGYGVRRRGRKKGGALIAAGY